MTRATALRAVSFFSLIFGIVHYAYKSVCRKHMIIQFCNTVILKYYFFLHAENLYNKGIHKSGAH